MSDPDRRWARAGVIGYATAGVGLAVAGLGGPPRMVVTSDGVQPALAMWIPTVAYLGLAVASGLILRGRPGARLYRLLAGLFLAYISSAVYEGAIRPLESALGDLGPMYTIGRLLVWLALGCSVALIASSLSTQQSRRWSYLSASGFVVILAAHLMAWVGASGRIPNLSSAALTRGLVSWATQLSGWLILFAAWQVVEGLHAAADAGTSAIKSFSERWLPWALIAKLVLVVLGLLFLPVASFPEWEAARSGRPIAWALALVVAGGVVTILRNRADIAVDRSSVALGAMAVVAIWMAPFLVGLSLVALGWFALVAAPNSIGDLIPLALVAVVAVLTYRWAARLAPPSFFLRAASLTLLVLVAVSPPTPTGAVGAVEQRVVSQLDAWNQVVLDVATPWQAWALLLLPVVGVLWLVRTRGNAPVAAALVIVGVLIFPRAISVLAAEVFDSDLPSGITPNLLMLDVALSIVILWRWFRGRADGTLHVGESAALAVAAAILSIVAYGSELGGFLVDGVSKFVAGLTGTELETTAFVLVLLLPAIYAIGFDAKALNVARSSRDVFTALGMGCVLLVIAVVLVPLGVMTPESTDDDLLRALIVPGLAVVAAVSAASVMMGVRPHEERVQP